MSFSLQHQIELSHYLCIPLNKLYYDFCPSLPLTYLYLKSFYDTLTNFVCICSLYNYIIHVSPSPLSFSLSLSLSLSVFLHLHFSDSVFKYISQSICYSLTVKISLCLSVSLLTEMKTIWWGKIILDDYGFSFPWLLPIAIYQNENKTKIKSQSITNVSHASLHSGDRDFVFVFVFVRFVFV